ncbi:Glycosyltransferase involved in cell wall bisynthesis [Psychroflexus salarius]|uniref:Glycosyltransferase involved in cell wall bisynthesis n=1 Tax=Psychroflexus salarius TaxID=1155689 RepID=A0A1M4X2X5_9FLAO|nr:glycosyltransferase [Psychroflexus salarius]SHE87846.1 Glycosyltransferase involved in cell wall bisynthesis [Psychroflexus salarius]
MTFLIISHTNHYKVNDQLYAYAPYVREINLWLKHVDQVNIVAPVSNNYDKNINLAYQHSTISIDEVPAFSLIGLKEKINTLKKLPKILRVLYKAMKQADHIHLRCPGNMGLLGCLVQILFPKTPKTAKYAGNWDPKSQQPWSYKLQKWILSNTRLTKNMQVLVYGQWLNQTKNIKPFFTATYNDSEKEPLYVRNYTKPWHFCFVGSLSKGKRPQLALELVNKLRQKGMDAVIHFYGDGELKTSLNEDLQQLNAQDWAFVYGNQPKDVVKKALKYSHFLILSSQSEGWPKVVAEAMFWGCIPIVTPISCVPWMLGDGQRGILIDSQNIDQTLKQLLAFKKTPKSLEQLSTNAAEWSRNYTLDKFEDEIRKLL